MSYATEYLKKTLLYDNSAKNLHLSQHITGLGEARESLMAAFGDQDIVVRQVSEVANPSGLPDPIAGIELLCMRGKTDFYGKQNRDIYIEFGLSGEIVVSMLVLVLLPRTWNLHEAFDQLPTEVVNNIKLAEATVVISYNIKEIGSHRSIRKEIHEDLLGYPLQDGMQIIAKTKQDPTSAADQDFLQRAKDAGLSDSTLPEITPDPYRIGIRGDLKEGWLTVEKWWLSSQPEGEAAGYLADDEVIHAAGIATRYDLGNDKNAPYSFLLRELDFAERPLVLEGHLIDNNQGEGQKSTYPIRFSSRLATTTPLGDAAKALSVLLGNRGTIFQELDLLPNLITLLSLTYSPGEWMLLSFAPGDYTDRHKPVIKVGPVILEEVNFTIQIPLTEQEGITYLELEGKAEFFGVHFRARMRPWVFIEGGLDDPEGIDLGQLLQKAVPVKIPFGLDTLRLSGAWVTHSLGGKREGTPTSTDLRVQLDGVVDLIPDAVQLRDVQIYASHNTDGENSFRLSADFTLGPVNLFTLVGYDDGNWIFSGSIKAEDKGISLTELVSHLVEAFGASVPEDVPDVHLESLSLEFHSATRYLEIQGITNWKIAEDVPVVGGSDNRVVLQLTMWRDSEQSSNSATLAIDWTLEKTGHTLSANALIAKDSQTFAFDFSVEDVNKPAKLSDLAEDIGLSTYIPSVVEGVLDDVFQVSSLALNYSRPGNNVDIAWTRPLAEGLLLMEYNQSTDDQATTTKGRTTKSGTKRHVGVSWVGNEENSTIGIENILDLIDQSSLLEDTESFLTDIGLDEVGEVMDTAKQILTFKHLGFSWDGSNQSNAFKFSAMSIFSGGMDAFLTVYTGDKGGFIVGVSFAKSGDDDGLSFKDLKFIPQDILTEITKLTKILADIELTYAILSSTQLNDFQPPSISTNDMLPSFARQGSPKVGNPFGSGSMKLNRGVSVGVAVKFGPESIVRKVIDVEKLYGQVTIGAGIVAVQVALPFGCKLDAGGGNSLALTSPVLQVKLGIAGPEFDIMGGLDLRLFGQRINVSGWLSLSEESIAGHIQITKIPDFIPIPTGYLRGVQIVIDEQHPFSAEIGLQFEPAGLEIGASGSFAIYKNEKDLVYGEAVLVLDIEEEVPNPIYVEFALEEMSVPLLLEAMTGLQLNLHRIDKAVKVVGDAATSIQEGSEAVSAAAAKANKTDFGANEATGAALQTTQDISSGIGEAAGAVAGASKATSAGIEAIEAAIGHVEALMSKVELKDVRLYLAETIVNLPDGSTTMPGFGFRGKLSVFDWDAFAMLDCSMSGIPGVSGHFECEPINIGNILRIWGDGQGIHKTPQKVEDLYKNTKKKVDTLKSGANLPSKNAAAVKDEGDWYLSPGGPVFHFSTRSSPFIHADLHAELFGVLHSDIHAEVTDEGFMFDLKIGADNVASGELECHWWKKEGQFEAHGNLDVKLIGDLGPIIPHIPATKISLNTSLDAAVSLIINKEKFEFTVNGEFMYQGARLVIPEIKITVSFSKLEDLAKLVWEWIEKNAEHLFAEAMASVAELAKKAAEEVKQVAVAAYDFGKARFDEAKDEVTKIDQAVIDGFQQGAVKFAETSEELKKKADEVLSGIESKTAELAAPILEDAKKLEDKLSDLKNETEQQLEQLGETAKAAIAAAAKYAIDVAKDAEEWVAQRWEDTRRWVDQRLQEARDAANQIYFAADAAVEGIEAEIDQVSREIGDLKDKLAELERVLQEAAESAFDEVTDFAGSTKQTVEDLLPW